MNYLFFKQAIADAQAKLKHAPVVHPERWQGLETKGRPEMATHEVLNFSFTVTSTDHDMAWMVEQIGPDVPWADDHFAERVSRQPLNPPPSEAYWPHAPKGNSTFKKGGIFSHTYPERYWPKHAGFDEPFDGMKEMFNRTGIRFPYGDLDDVVRTMLADPLTRQAFLPLWFPEDTGAPNSERKPCTLGYHFIMRDDQLHIVYYIRSCDFLRHFRNDIYMTVLLQHWFLDELRSRTKTPLLWEKVVPGSFTMHITSLHLFRNDYRQVFA